VEVDGRSADAVVELQGDYKENEGVPDQARSESALEAWLIEEAGLRAAGKIAPSPDPVEAFLAVDKPLKAGNELAQRGMFKEALASWTPLKLKGDEDAARQHNLGVAHEAIAYSLPPESAEHRSELDQAAELYAKAKALDPGEKYFAPPLERIQASLRHAENAMRLAEERRVATEALKARTAKSAAASKKTPVTPAKSATPAKAAPSAKASAVRNGGFDTVLAPWIVDGDGRVAKDAKRGGVFEAKAAYGASLISQPVTADLSKAAGATLKLAYRVTSGEAHIKFSAVYEDAGGRAKTHTADVTSGEGPGAWSDWSAELTALRPKPARITEIRLEVEGGTAQLDDVRLDLR
jgi:hypothetical protein